MPNLVRRDAAADPVRACGVQSARAVPSFRFLPLSGARLLLSNTQRYVVKLSGNGPSRRRYHSRRSMRGVVRPRVLGGQPSCWKRATQRGLGPKRRTLSRRSEFHVFRISESGMYEQRDRDVSRG